MKKRLMGAEYVEILNLHAIYDVLFHFLLVVILMFKISK